MNKKVLLFKEELEIELKNILDYWIENTVDEENGGFYGQINHFNEVIPKAPKGAVLNTRILWTFSAAFNHTGNKSCLEIATRAFEYVKNHFYDKKNGGLFWELDFHGNPSNTRKQIYAQGFGIYGFSEYFKASGDKESLDLAKALFDQVEKYSYDKEHGGYIEALSEDWKSMKDMRLSERDENYPKSMNTHLHILEPYTNLYREWESPVLKDKIETLIRTFLDHIIDSKTNHLNLFFETDWEVKSNVVSYGHDIEGSWLLTEAAEIVENEFLLREVQDVAIKMTNATLTEGISKDGGLYYEMNNDTGHLDSDKHWWPQAEAMVGFVNAYQISGNNKYLQKSLDIWQFIKDKMIDRRKGEWFWRVDKDGIPNEQEDKAGFWKCPYHNGRACIEVIDRISSALS